MKWVDKKLTIISALEDYGYIANKANGTWQKTIENNPMISVVNLKTQPKQNETIPVYFINSDDLDGGKTESDINGVLESTKQMIRSAINVLDAEQKNADKAKSDEPTKPQVKPEKTGEHNIKPIKHNDSTVIVRPPQTNITISGPSELTIDLIQSIINPLASVEEARFFLEMCKSQKLNPFIGEAYLIKYGTGPATYVVGKDAHLKRAEEQKSFDGFKAGIIVQTEKGIMEEREGNFYIKGAETLVGGWAEVHRKDIEMYFISKVPMEEYMGRKKDGTITKMWATKPATMIRKVALVQALREAYIGLLGGMYDVSEIKDIDVEVIE